MFSNNFERKRRLTSSEIVLSGDMIGVGKALPDFLKLCCKLHIAQLMVNMNFNTSTVTTSSL